MSEPAVVLANGAFKTPNGKTSHGLIRGSTRFQVLALVDPSCAGEDAGEALDGVARGIPIVATLDEAIGIGTTRPRYCVVGVATHGGHLTDELRRALLEAARRGLALVNGLHDAASDDPEIAAAARESGVEIVDLRKTRPKNELHFWNGSITTVRAPRIAVMGMDCAIGKRTTTKMLVDTLNDAGVRTEMIYTGQTGWMQGSRYGFVLDSVINDYVSGELEHALVSCDREARPDLMVIEGQSSMRNPSGPCGAEFLCSGAARGVVIQHAPGRRYFEGYEKEGFVIPPVDEEMELVRLYGSRTLAITLSEQYLRESEAEKARVDLAERLGVPVIRPLKDGLEALVTVVRDFIREETEGPGR